MPSVRVVEPGSLPWLESRDGRGGEDKIEVVGPPERSAVRFLHPGGESELFLHEAQIRPYIEVEAHAHRADEIIFILEGEMHLGARLLRPGMSVYIPANTLYAFKSGPDGLRLLNFRGRRDPSHVLKAEFMAERAAAKVRSDRPHVLGPGAEHFEESD